VGDRLAADLLGAGVLGRHRQPSGARQVDRYRHQFGVEEFGDAEVEELRGPVGGDEDIAGLEIAVDDEVLVGDLDGLAHLAEQDEAPSDRQAVLVAVAVDRDTLDVLHHEVRQAVVGGAAVEQPRDVRVVDGGQDLALGAEATDDVLGVSSRV
jgi:hypothetical protein